MKTTLKKFKDLVKAEKERFNSFGVKRVGIFGSCVRGEDRADSDIDILVEFSEKNFDNYMNLKFFLEEYFGRNVDLVIVSSLKPALRDEILKEVEYAA